MKKKILKSTIFCALISLFVLIAALTPARRTSAASSNISINDFIKLVDQAAKVTVVTSTEDAYISAAKTAGFIKDGEYTDYTKTLTRTDAAVIINRAYEYLNGDKLNKTLYDFVYKKRISDLKKVSESKRAEVAEAVARGFFENYSNGYYVKSRSFKGTSKVTNGTAKLLIARLTGKSKKAKLSPDGLLIRTTHLPKNAKRYEYILACYPNSFYEKKFFFETWDGFDPKKDAGQFYYPADMRNTKYINLHEKFSMSGQMDKYLYDWEDKAETYLHYVLNVNYKTVNSKWVNGLSAVLSTDVKYEAAKINKYYIPDMKKNKVVIKTSNIVVEPSAFAYDDTSGYTMRCYVRYKITAKNIHDRIQGIIYSTGWPYLKNLKNGKWRTGIYDISFSSCDPSNGDASSLYIASDTSFID